MNDGVRLGRRIVLWYCSERKTEVVAVAVVARTQKPRCVPDRFGLYSDYDGLREVRESGRLAEEVTSGFVLWFDFCGANVEKKE